jgi:hypothetical protein
VSGAVRGSEQAEFSIFHFPFLIFHLSSFIFHLPLMHRCQPAPSPAATATEK